MKTTVARVLMAAGVLFAVTLATAGPAAADCPSPTISISPSSGRGGDTFQIHGSGFFQSCSDAGNVGDTNVQFRFLQGGNVYDLGSATAGTPNGDFTGNLFVPTNTTAGSATVQAFGANGSPAVPFTVTASTVASGGGTTPATTPRASTATTAAPVITPANPAPTTATTSTTVAATTTTLSTTPAAPVTTPTTIKAKKSSGLTGSGLAVTIILLALVVLGTLIASLATAGRLPLPKGRPRPRVERAQAAEAAAAAAAAGAAGAAGTAAVVDDEPDRYESSRAPIEPIPDPFAPTDEPEATASIEAPTSAFDDEPSAALDDGEPSAALDDEEPSAALDDEEPSAAIDDEEPSAAIDDAEPSAALDDDEPSASLDDAPPAPDEIAFPDEESPDKPT